MLKVEGHEGIRTNHIMIPDYKGRVYCFLINEVVKWSDKFYECHCTDCQYLNGLGQNIGAIECVFDDGSENIVETVDDPFLFVQSKVRLGIKKS